MIIRRANPADIPRIIEMLSQVLEVHAAIRPDIFVSGTTKYNADELAKIIADDTKPIFVALPDDENVDGYAFCQLKEPSFARTMVPRKTLFIDDLCVDESARGSHIGKALFDHVISEAKQLGCYEITLNVWEGNDSALAFYKAMGMMPQETRMELIL